MENNPADVTNNPACRGCEWAHPVYNAEVVYCLLHYTVSAMAARGNRPSRQWMTKGGGAPLMEVRDGCTVPTVCTNAPLEGWGKNIRRQQDMVTGDTTSE